MITPRLGAVVMTPTLKRMLYLLSISAGIMNPPMATTVATVEPLMAPNRPQARMPAMARPPGSQPTITLAKRISLFTMEPLVMMLPQRMKNSTTTRAKLSIDRNRLWASTNRGRSVKSVKPATAVKNRQRNTGTVAAMAPNSTRMMMI